MTVYVDSAMIVCGRMKMCHMVADTEEELHQMADKIGVNRRWYQDRASTPHYDICMSKRKLALSHGAIPITRKDLGAFLKKRRLNILTAVRKQPDWL